ncbi:UDP-glycosyltransferase 76B1 [Citrus sinensis]|uniref:UDP-glycosyltransferase 76B1 n=1 Tax=Citrus sinensis TaxID=2711 RepID=A0ACB8MEI8_CITSI|nr:UDP-glycosyltransferase 76B1 [Citrus sinensis]
MEGRNDSCRMVPRNGRRVILFPLPFQGHINPMLHLASILYSKGFSVTIIHTDFNFSSTNYFSCNYPHFDFHSFPDGFSETEASVEDVAVFFTAINGKCIMPFRDCLAEILMKSKADQNKDSSPCCLITDAFWFFTHTVAADFKLPTIVLQTCGVSGFLAFTAYPILRERAYLPVQGVIWNSYRDLEQAGLGLAHQKYLSIPIFPIGPLHKCSPASSGSLSSQDYQRSISWLDKQTPKSVVYISFGSVIAINKDDFLEIAWGVANSRMPFLWVVRPGLVSGAEWVEPLPKGFLEMLDGRGCIVKWAPQQQVLAHPAVGGFWTHSGWNSTLESICEGVPMICQPYLPDQMVNARYVSHFWRVGLHSEWKLERMEIERTIRRVMVEAEGQEMRVRIMHLKEKVDFCLRKGGSSHQSLERLIDHILSF